MGLNDLNGMDIPDNKGGRPSKDDNEEQHARIAAGDPHTLDKDEEDWWYQKYTKYVMEADSVDEAITLIAENTFVNPIEIRKKLDEFGIHETDWDNYIDTHPAYENDARIPGNELNESYSTGMSSRLDDVMGTASSSNNDDDGPSDGLSSLM